MRFVRVLAAAFLVATTVTRASPTTAAASSASNQNLMASASKATADPDSNGPPDAQRNVPEPATSSQSTNVEQEAGPDPPSTTAVADRASADSVPVHANNANFHANGASNTAIAGAGGANLSNMVQSAVSNVPGNLVKDTGVLTVSPAQTGVPLTITAPNPGTAFTGDTFSSSTRSGVDSTTTTTPNVNSSPFDGDSSSGFPGLESLDSDLKNLLKGVSGLLNPKFLTNFEDTFEYLSTGLAPPTPMFG